MPHKVYKDLRTGKSVCSTCYDEYVTNRARYEEDDATYTYCSVCLDDIDEGDEFGGG